MADAVLRYGDRELSLTATQGTEGDVALDIGRLRSDLGVTTTDRGFANTAEGESAVTYINGEEGILRYRGYSIEQLAEHASFLEVAYLLQYGELPNKSQRKAYEQRISRHTLLREDTKHLFEAFPHRAHPMQILASATSALATYYPDALDPLDEESVDVSSARLIAKTPTMIAWSYKYAVHQPYVYPDNDLDYAANFLQMMFSVPAEKYHADPVIT
ncbi:MAG: citrate/2-methylcitrate synthase, partial [Acidimicrobiia bacterium]